MLLKLWNLAKSIINFAHKAIMCVVHAQQLFKPGRRNFRPYGRTSSTWFDKLASFVS